MRDVESLLARAAGHVVDDGLDYAGAKQKAAKALGHRGSLPSNEALEDAVREHIAVFHADEQPGELRALRVLALDWKTMTPAAFAATLLARLSGDRERDLSEALRQRVIQQLRSIKAPATWLQMIEDVVELDEADTGRVFGETLPPGLRLVG